MKICETERLILREITSDDAEFDYLLNQDPDVIKYTGDGAYESVEAAKNFLENDDLYKKYGFGRWAVIDKTDNSFLGWCGLKYTANPDELDIGFRFYKKYWNQGYATESVKACVDLGLNSFGMETIVGRTMKENKSSIRVLEKIGLKYYRDSKYSGKEGVIYKIEKSELSQGENQELVPIEKNQVINPELSINKASTLSDALQTILSSYTPALFIISEAEFNYSPNQQKWSKKEILGHLIDSATNNHHRIIRAQQEEIPEISFEQNEWVALNHYKTMPSKQLISFWSNYNTHLVSLIKEIPEECFQNKCNTGTIENVSLEFVVSDYIRHLEHHLKQITEG